MSAKDPKTTIIERLTTLLLREVWADDRQRASVRLADWLGCAMAGAAEPAGRILMAGSAKGAEADAFRWGGLGNILEMDDVDKKAILHPAPSIIPAALALAAEIGADGDALQTAIVRGYEATIRLGRAVGAGHYAIWHTTGTCGAIGAAAACASLLGLNAAGYAHALALAMSQSTGFWQTRHEPTSMGKQLHTSNAARAGVSAALLAKSGFTGPLTILEGEQGFFAATCPDGDVEKILAEADSDWKIADISTKPWPACRHTHAVIDAALFLRRALGGVPESVITVRTFSDALKFCDRPDPTTPLEAKFSLQHAVAVVMARGEPQLKDFEPDAIADSELTAIRKRVEVVSDCIFTGAYPARFGASVDAQGQSCAVPDAWGDPENPISDDEVYAKTHTLCAWAGVSAQDQDKLLAAVKAKDVSALVSMMKGHFHDVSH